MRFRQSFFSSLLLLVLLTLVACQPEEAVVTPPVVVADSETSEVTVTEPESAEEPAVQPTEAAESVAVAEPATPTPEPTAESQSESEPLPATNTPQPAPTDPPPPPTEIPSAPVNSISLSPVAGGFFKPLGLVHANDDRMFVVEQVGIIKIIQNGQVLETPFINMDAVVNSNANEQGLLGVAFHPSYASNGRFFVNYTDSDGRTVIAEYTVSADDPNVADPDSARIILIIEQPYRNHNGGQIQFGPDGYLYIGMGDGGSQDDPLDAGQDATQLLGAMLRIDIDNGEPYGIPADNPGVTNDQFRNEIWATGLRNPWRFSFDRETGDMFIADVGQNVWEEINFQPAGVGGLNYGWRPYEASTCYLGPCDPTGLTMPAAEYDHASGGHCSVTGGYMYRGQAYPQLYGNYFYADYCSGTIWRMFQTSPGEWDSAIIGEVDFLVSSFGEDVNGELYILSQTEGVVYQVTP